MPRFWLTYNQESRVHGVVVMDSSSLIQARIRAAGEIELQGEFAEGHQIDEAVAPLVPATAIGRILSLEEAHALLDHLEIGISKRPSTPSVMRNAAAGQKRA